MNWYEENIEPEIIPLVKLLRNNGFNTTSSCGHKMWVEMEFYNDSDLTILQEILRENGYEYFVITAVVEYHKGLRYYGRSLKVELMVNERGEKGV